MLNFFRLALATRDVSLSWKLARKRIPRIHVERREDGCYLEGTGIRCQDALPFVTPPLSYWLTRLGRWGGEFEIHAGGALTVKCGDVELFVDGADVCLVAEEVFGRREYGFCIQRPSVLIDIGMNVGLTALFFAAQPLCHQVFGFEPVGETFERAKRNFAQNPTLVSKITAYPYGLGGSDYEATAVRVAGNSAVARTIRLDKHGEQRGGERVVIRDASCELSRIADLAGDRSIILKIDCEGGEREILETIPGNVLRRIGVIMLEWHSAAILSAIIPLLEASGHTLFATRASDEVGMLYAVGQPRNDK